MKARNGQNTRKKSAAKYSGDDVKRYIGAVSEEFRGHVKAVAEQYSDIKRTLDSHTEILNSHTKTLDSHTETLDSHTETLDSHTEILNSHTKTLDSHGRILHSHAEMIGKLMEDTAIIKSNIEFIKGGLKKKVDYDEFMSLERRLVLLEAKSRRV